jgi:hypothetical protein
MTVGLIGHCKKFVGLKNGRVLENMTPENSLIVEAHFLLSGNTTVSTTSALKTCFAITRS